MAKKINGYIRLQIPAGQANPSPPIGPALGQRGLNIMEFCKTFNAHTQKMVPGVPIKKAVGMDKGSEMPGREIIGSISMAQVRAIAEQKMVDLNADDLDQAAKMIDGSARSMGITVES